MKSSSSIFNRLQAHNKLKPISVSRSYNTFQVADDNPKTIEFVLHSKLDFSNAVFSTYLRTPKQRINLLAFNYYD